jgi:type IV pilus biogenesis protein CpaD/CtpE
LASAINVALEEVMLVAGCVIAVGAAAFAVRTESPIRIVSTERNRRAFILASRCFLSVKQSRETAARSRQGF